MAKSFPGRQIRGITDQPDFSLETWPTPDVGALSEEALRSYLDRKLAIELCVAGASDSEIKRTCGIGLKQATRLIKERCGVPSPDGRVFGFRGLLKHVRIKAVTRKKPVRIDKFGRGGAGAMNSLLEIDPEFRRKLDAKILRGHKSTDLVEIKRPRTSVWRWFLDELRERGYEIRKEWPFNTDSLGYGALRRYTDNLLRTHPRAMARLQGGENSERKLRAGDGVDRPVLRPFQRVEMDAHKLDGRFCVLMPGTGGGWVPRIIHRLWVIVILEVITRAVLGYHLSLRREVNKEDVLRALKSALSDWHPLPSVYSEKPLVEGAGLPSVLGKQFVGLCWDETSVDGALAETCTTVKEKLASVVGSALISPDNSFAVRRSLDDRPFIETFFRILGSRGLQRLSNSTGPNPRARMVSKPDEVAITSEFQFEYLIELLQALICNYNATPHSALGYRLPLEMVQYFAQQGSLPERRADPVLVEGLLSYRKLCTVHGGAAEGRLPYINFDHGRYSGPSIRDREDLVGKKVWMINHIEDDARIARCTTVSGQLVGILRVAPPWDKLPHSLAVRRSIKSFQTANKIHHLGNDAIHTFMEYVNKQPRKKLPVHPVYLEIQRILSSQASSFEGDKAAQRAFENLQISSHKSNKGDPLNTNQVPKESSPKRQETKKQATSETDSMGVLRKMPARRLAAN